MNNTKPNKSIKRGLVTKGFLVLLSLIILIFITSFAWFYSKINEANASGLTVKTSGSANFEYAIGFYNSMTGQTYICSDWIDSSSSALNLQAVEAEGETYNLLEDYQPVDITGDGSTLIKPAMKYMNKFVDQDSNNFSYAIPNKQYITFDLLFRAPSSGIKISLSEGCNVKGAWESYNDKNTLTTTDSAVIGNDDFRVSTYAKTGVSKDGNPIYQNGAFSKDAIAGAVRMSFVNFKELNSDESSPYYILGNSDKTSEDALYNDNCVSTPTVLWNPRGDLCLNPDADDSLYNWTLDTNLLKNNNKGFSYSNDNDQTTITTSTYDHTYYQIFQGMNVSSNVSGPHTFTTINPGDSTYNLVNEPSGEQIAEISDVKIGDLYYTKVKVNIWIDGCDKEARRALSGGNFVFNLNIEGNS